VVLWSNVQGLVFRIDDLGFRVYLPALEGDVSVVLLVDEGEALEGPGVDGW